MHTIMMTPGWLRLLRWTGRILAVLVFLFWGGFFVEHTVEWFIAPFPQLPPVQVWIAQSLHCLMLVGLLVALRWELIGGAITVGSAFIFLVDKTGANFPWFFGGTILPIVLLAAAGLLARKIQPVPGSNA